MNPSLLSGRSLSIASGVPKTTVQNYLKKYAPFFQWHGQGQQKRYDAHAVELVKFIRILYTKGYDHQTITQALAHPSSQPLSSIQAFQKLREIRKLTKPTAQKKRWFFFGTRKS